MNRNRVSVVLATRNQLDVLPKAIESVRSQNIAEIEIIVADDGSSDGTLLWLKALQIDEPRLRIVKTGGKGLASAKNRAISMAKSPLIAFLDPAYTWDAGKLKWQVAYHERNPETGFSFTDSRQADKAGGSGVSCFQRLQPTYADRPPQGYDLLENAEAKLLGCNTTCLSTVVARREFLQIATGFATDMPFAEDWDLCLRLAAIAPVACSTIITASQVANTRNPSLEKPVQLHGDLQATATIKTTSAIIERYRLSKPAGFRGAIRQAEAQLHAAKADMARLDGDYWAAIGEDILAMVANPAIRNARAAATDAVHGMRNLIKRDSVPPSNVERTAA